jgi:hypothetical protein
MRVAALLCIVVSAVGAQQPTSAISLPDRLGADTRATIVRLADSARAAGIPVEPIEAKAAEGVLKGADDARILRAVRSLVAELAAARGALPGASASVLTAAASALHAGATVTTLRDLAIAAERRDVRGHDADLALAFIRVADLAASGVSADRAASALAQLLRRGARDTEISAFRAGVARDIGDGRAPEQALTARMRDAGSSSDPARSRPPG